MTKKAMLFLSICFPFLNCFALVDWKGFLLGEKIKREMELPITCDLWPFLRTPRLQRWASPNTPSQPPPFIRLLEEGRGKKGGWGKLRFPNIAMVAPTLVVPVPKFE